MTTRSKAPRSIALCIACTLGACAAPQVRSLSAHEVEQVIRANSLQLRHACWQSYDPNVTEASITTSLSVAGDGTVASVEARSDYPDLSRCIAERIRTWKLPAAGGTTTVNLPFHFLKQ